jgi:hypothetical protein
MACAIVPDRNSIAEHLPVATEVHPEPEQRNAGNFCSNG